MRTIVKIHILFLIAIFVNLTASVAENNRDLQQGNADYPVPEPMALNAIRSDVPQILIPSSVRSLAISFNNYTLNDNKNHFAFGMEAAPLMFSNSTDLSKYLSGRWMRELLRSRFSFATEINNNKISNLSFGFRLMNHDDADPRADSNFQKTLLMFAYQDSLLSLRCFDNNPQNSENRIKCLTDGVSHITYYQRMIDSLRESMKDNLWNKSVFEVALAFLYHSPNNNKLEFQRVNVWTSAGFPIFGNDGQIVFGLSGWLGRDNLIERYQRRLSTIIQMHYGNHSQRFYFETKFITADINHPDYSLGIGSMMRIINGLWVNVGIDKSINNTIQQGIGYYIRFSIGTPEIKN